MAEPDFSKAESGASATYPMQCSALRKGGHVLMKGHPCKIVELSTSKTGKHGHAKVNITGLDIFTQKKYEDICPSTHNVAVPNVTRKDYVVVDVVDGYLTLMDEAGDTREDIKLPDNDLGREIQRRYDSSDGVSATLTCALKEEHVTALKTNN